MATKKTARAATAPKAAKPAKAATAVKAAKASRIAKTASRTASKNASAKAPAAELPVLALPTEKAWQRWLDANHATSPGVWLQFAKKSSAAKSVARNAALDLALCYGWIDGQAQSRDADSYLQKFTPRRSRSMWSKINCDKAEALIESGTMRPAGQAEVDRAKQDGRWAAAYAGPRTIEVPDDLQAALDRNRKAAAFFGTISSRNRYAILFRIHHAKKAETRARRIDQFVGMLERHETIYP